MGDLISREALEEMGVTCFARRNENGQLEAIISLDNAPTVKSYTLEDLEKAKNNGYKWGRIDGKKERPQGEWELHGMIYYCSNCGHYCGESGDNFCGNCGADMRGEE